MTFNHFRRAKIAGYRSGLEDKVAKQLEEVGLDYEYEGKDSKIDYTSPPKPHKYTPDFTFNTHIIIETKGRFMPEDRQKHLLIKQQHPEFDIRFVFSNSKSKISKTSKTTYADWCDKHDFKYADKWIPDEWLKEIRDLQLSKKEYKSGNKTKT
jgi:hypothetical protein